MIALGLFSDAKRFGGNQTGSPQLWCQMQVGWVKIGDIRQITRYNSKTVQKKCTVSTKVEQEVICALWLCCHMTLGDP